MNTRLDPLIVDAALALERMAFVAAEPIEVAPGDELDAATFRASIEIRGAQPGFALVAGNVGFVVEVAAGMLGIDPGEVVVAEHGAATVLELANVLGGQVLREAGGDDAAMALGLPVEVSPARAHELLAAALQRGFAGVLATENGRLVLAGVKPGNGDG